MGESMKQLLGAIAAACVLVTAPLESASAREFKDIVKPYYDRWGKWQKIRKEMRKRLKDGEAFTGDDWFVLGSVCAIQPPSSGSMIRDALNKSPCRDDTIPYMVKAAENGTPRGYLQAARWTVLWGGSQAQAWQYAALAYRFSARDPDLTADARAYIGKIGYSPTEADTQAVNRTAMQLVANGVYPGDGPSEDVRLADLTWPELDWLKFVDRSKCAWGSDANHILSDMFRWNSRGKEIIPHTFRVPTTKGDITSRITRQYGGDPHVRQIDVDLTGQFHGLKVTGLTRIVKLRSDELNSAGIRFQEPVREVAEKLLAAGFLVNRDGSTRDSTKKTVNRWAGPDGGGRYETWDGAITSITRKGNETIFLCDRNAAEGV